MQEGTRVIWTTRSGKIGHGLIVGPAVSEDECEVHWLVAIDVDAGDARPVIYIPETMLEEETS